MTKDANKETVDNSSIFIENAESREDQREQLSKDRKSCLDKIKSLTKKIKQNPN